MAAFSGRTGPQQLRIHGAARLDQLAALRQVAGPAHGQQGDQPARRAASTPTRRRPPGRRATAVASAPAWWPAYCTKRPNCSDQKYGTGSYDRPPRVAADDVRGDRARALEGVVPVVDEEALAVAARRGRRRSRRPRTRPGSGGAQAVVGHDRAVRRRARCPEPASQPVAGRAPMPTTTASGGQPRAVVEHAPRRARRAATRACGAQLGARCPRTRRPSARRPRRAARRPAAGRRPRRRSPRSPASRAAVANSAPIQPAPTTTMSCCRARARAAAARRRPGCAADARRGRPRCRAA